jgi:hypothetical protein
MAHPSTERRYDNVLKSFLTHEEVDAGATARLASLSAKEAGLKSQLDASEKFGVLISISDKAHDDYLKANELAEASKPRGYTSTSEGDAADRYRELRESADLKYENYNNVQGEVDEFPGNVEYEEVRELRRRMFFALEGAVTEHSKGAEEIHGITRERIAAILAQIDAGEVVDREDIEAEPSILAEIRKYFERWEVTDRISFGRVIIGEEMSFPGHSVPANYLQRNGVRGLCPRNLMGIALGRKIEAPNLDDVLDLSDILYGKLDKLELIAQVKGCLREQREIDSRRKALRLTNTNFREVAMETEAGSILVLSRVLLGSSPGLLGGMKGLNKKLVDVLFPEEA